MKRPCKNCGELFIPMNKLHTHCKECQQPKGRDVLRRRARAAKVRKAA